MIIFCDRKTCKFIKWNMFYELHCGCNKTLTLKSGKCTNFEKLSAEEMKVRREKAPYKDIY